MTITHALAEKKTAEKQRIHSDNISPLYRKKPVQSAYEDALIDFAATLRLSKDF